MAAEKTKITKAVRAPVSAAELQRLADDICEHGLHEPIHVLPADPPGSAVVGGHIRIATAVRNKMINRISQAKIQK